MGKRKDSYLARFNRILVWLTCILLVFFIVCGFGITNPLLINAMTGGVLTRSLSLHLHTTLAAPVMTLLVIHAMIGLRFNMIRWGVKEGKLLNVFTIGLSAFLIALFIIMEFAVF